MFARTFFVTTVTARRFPLFRDEGKARLLMETLFHYQTQRKYELHEFVIMPDHIHLLLTPSRETSLERVVQFIKGGFSYRLHAQGTVWQESFTNHRIRDEDDFEQHREYIRMNPVEARLARRPEDYPYSSRAIKADTDSFRPVRG
jgi:putative transposase